MYELADLINAIRGYEMDQKNQWERVRVLSAYSLLPYHDSKKHGSLRFTDIKLPIDPPDTVKPEQLSNIEELNKTELIDEYKRCGFQIEDEDFLNRILRNQN